MCIEVTENRDKDTSKSTNQSDSPGVYNIILYVQQESPPSGRICSEHIMLYIIYNEKC